MGGVPRLQVGAEILPLVEDLSIFRSGSGMMERRISRLMDAASGVVMEGSVTRVMNVYDHFLALLGVAVLHERPTHLSVLSRALLSTHPNHQPIRWDFYCPSCDCVQEEAGLWGLFTYLQGVPSVVCLLIVPSETRGGGVSANVLTTSLEWTANPSLRPLPSCSLLSVSVCPLPRSNMFTVLANHTFLWALNVAAPVTMATLAAPPRPLLLFATSTVETEA